MLLMRRQSGKMFNLMTKIMSGVSVTLLVGCLVLYSLLLGKTNEIKTQQNTITQLNSNNKVLEARIKICQSICLAEKNARETQQSQIDKLRTTETTLLEKLTTLQDEESDKKDIFDRGVSPERSRMLNNHCERVRGSPCNNP